MSRPSSFLNIIIVHSREPPWRPQSGQLLNAFGHMEALWKCAFGTSTGAPMEETKWSAIWTYGGAVEVRLWHLHGSFHGDHKVGSYLMHLGIWRCRGGAPLVFPRELPWKPPSGQLANASGHMEVPSRCAFGTSTRAPMEATELAAT